MSHIHVHCPGPGIEIDNYSDTWQVQFHNYHYITVNCTDKVGVKQGNFQFEMSGLSDNIIAK